MRPPLRTRCRIVARRSTDIRLSHPLWELLKPVFQPVKRDWNANAFFRRLEYHEDGAGTARQCLDQSVIENDLGHAAIGQAAHKGHSSHVLTIDIQAQYVGQQYAERR